MTTILLIEDDPTLSQLLQHTFVREGYSFLTTADGIDGLALARSARPDLLLLDLMLPQLDGFSLCRILRAESGMPIILLSGRQDEIDRIAGLELGADDYLTKPFGLGELLARVRAVLRRSGERQQQTPEPDVLQSGLLRLDRVSRRVWQGEREIELSFKEFDLLACLMHNSGVALSRDLLLERVWGDTFCGDNRTVDVHIRWLREKVEVVPNRPIYIQTVRGVGYRFQVSLSASAERASAAYSQPTPN